MWDIFKGSKEILEKLFSDNSNKPYWEERSDFQLNRNVKIPGTDETYDEQAILEEIIQSDVNRLKKFTNN